MQEDEAVVPDTRAASDDTHSDYYSAKRAAAESLERGVWRERFEPRFEPVSDREMRSDLPREAIKRIAEGKHFASYRGLPMAKDPLDRVLYETLFYELRPRTVVELGAYTGASAMWMADVLKTFGTDSRVIAVDLDLELVDDSARLHGGVEFLEGDLNDVESLLPADLLAGLEGPIVLIDDAHVNIAEVYRHSDRYLLQRGDYLIIEDTIPWIPASFGVVDAERTDHAGEWGDWKWDEVSAFFAASDSKYDVDRYYTDFFGYNATWNWNGFLRKS